MNEQELKNIIVTKDLEIYKLRTELALAQKQVKELTSYLDQVTTPVKDKVTPEPPKNEPKEPPKEPPKKEKKSKVRGIRYKYLTEEELVKRFKVDGISSSVPYYWYHSRGIIVPEWARESSNKYLAERKSLRTTNLSPVDYIQSLAEEALQRSREIADLVK